MAPSAKSTRQMTVSACQEANYNASIVDIHRMHDDLMILRVRHDHGALSFEPGQYTVLGLAYGEPRVSGCQDEALQPDDLPKIVKRAYSISCSICSPDGDIVRATDGPDVEFYVALLRRAPNRPPALTPRLFALAKGQRIYMSDRCHGHYTLGNIESTTDDLVFLSTGTGEAPHNAMLAELIDRQHAGRIVSAVCTRYRRDLAYLEAQRRVERVYSSYTYLPITTREPENIDPNHADYVGKLYLQDYFSSGRLESDCGFRFVPDRTHVFLCGTPDMIGVPHHTHDPERRYPHRVGMIELLEQRGFVMDQPHAPGNVHFERYW